MMIPARELQAPQDEPKLLTQAKASENNSQEDHGDDDSTN